MTARPRLRTAAAATASLATAAAVTGGLVLGQGQTSLAYEPQLAASTSIGGGVAVDPEGLVQGLVGDDLWNEGYQTPLLGLGLVPPIKDIWNDGIGPFAPIKDEFGDTTAIAVLPGAALAFADAGESATAFSVLGLALATTDITFLEQLEGIPGFPITIPTGQVACFGVLTAAHSSTEGACLNILGTLDAHYDKNREEISFALTNPAGLLTDGLDPAGLIQAVLAGQPLSQLLTSDFVRLTLGGENMVALTSSYGFQDIGNGVNGGVEIEWLGTKIVLFPAITTASGLLGGVQQVNYLGIPEIGFGMPTSLNDIIPSITVGDFKLPFNITIPGWSTGDLLGGSSTAADRTVTLASEDVASAPIIADTPTSSVPSSAADDTEESESSATTEPAEQSSAVATEPSVPSTTEPAAPSTTEPSAPSTTETPAPVEEDADTDEPAAEVESEAPAEVPVTGGDEADDSDAAESVDDAA